VSYEYAMGTLPESSRVGDTPLCTVEQIRAAHLAYLDEISQSESPIMREQAQIALEAMELTDDQLAVRRTQAAREEERLHDALTEASATSRFGHPVEPNLEIAGELRPQLSRARNEVAALRLDWSRRDRERTMPGQCQRDIERREEVENMWTSGQWREHDIYTRWLEQRFVAINPLRYWLGLAHCAVIGPSEGRDSRCAGHMPPNRPLAIGLTLLPFATGYWAWKKKDGSLPWTAFGAAAGVVGPMIAWATLFSAAMGVGGGFRY
jgi:hypothetical protein